MNFSYEELYSMYGQFDTNITITFHYNSPAYKIFGSTLMGSIIYTEEDRIELEKLLQLTPAIRSKRNVRLQPSTVIKISEEQYEQAERYGFLCSDIAEILSYKRPRTNQFTEKGQKEIGNTIPVYVNIKPNEINRLFYGFLSSRFSRGQQLSPMEINKYLGLRKYYNEDNSQPPYSTLNQDKNEVKYYELDAKLTDLNIEGDDIKELGSLIAERYIHKEKLIEDEIQKSRLKLSEAAEKYGDELKNLRKICHRFEEEIILFGDKLIYLDIERFLHIYARHVTETQLGGEFIGKTVFQYKFDDIMRIIKMVVESEADNIQQYFKDNPNGEFRRIGKRSIYFDGQYYRVEIDKAGRLLTFHPYNNNDQRDRDTE